MNKIVHCAIDFLFAAFSFMFAIMMFLDAKHNVMIFFLAGILIANGIMMMNNIDRILDGN